MINRIRRYTLKSSYVRGGDGDGGGGGGECGGKKNMGK